MIRDFIEVKNSSWTRGFLAQFKSFMVESRKSPDPNTFLVVRGFQQIKRGVISYSIDISQLGVDWANALPDVFSLYSLVPHYNKNTGESYERLTKVIFRKQMLKKYFLICYPLKIFFANRNRKKRRYNNSTDSLFVENFFLPQGKVDVVASHAFIASLYKKTSSILKSQFTYVDIDFWESKKNTSIALVQEKMQPFWVSDHNLFDLQGNIRSRFLKNEEMKEKLEKDQMYLWQWNNQEIVLLGLPELREFEKTQDQEIDNILAEFDGQKTQDHAEISQRRRYRGEAVYPIICLEKSREVPVGYIQVLTKDPLEKESLALIEEQVEWLNSTIVQGVFSKVRAHSRVLNFSIEGLSIFVEDKSLIEILNRIEFFKLKLFFVIGEDKVKIEASVKIAYKKFVMSDNMILGLFFRSFDPVINENGEMSDGKAHYLNAMRNFESRYGTSG